MSKTTPLILTILDGWGYSPHTHANAIALAKTPTMDALLRDFPHTLLHASDHFVGLPDGQMGNSEVGHLNIGAGRVVQMDVTRIDAQIASGEFFTNPVLEEAMELAVARGRSLHLLGLVSDGGVHSHQRHLYALLKMAKQLGLEKVFVHAFLDGRDTLPQSAVGYLEQLQYQMRQFQIGELASVSGRYYAMDRDRRWEREKKTFDAMVTGNPEGGMHQDPVARLKEFYSAGVTDEFVIPYTCTRADGTPIARVGDEDVCICFNYRADRARQITRVLARRSGLSKVDPSELPGGAELDIEIPRSSLPESLRYVCMTQYDKMFTLPRVIPPESMENLLADVMGKAELKNLRVAETEKYAHVTYFFNGGVEKPFPGEERILVPSQKVATYDLAPEMSAAAIAETVVKAIESKSFEVIVVNFANADMVAHSGKLEETIRGVQFVDAGLGEIYRAIRRSGGTMLVTADHGNAEQMIDPATGGPHTAHTTNPVPCVLVSEAGKLIQLRQGGSLRDLSPTIVSLLHLELPAQMSGVDLRENAYLDPG